MEAIRHIESKFVLQLAGLTDEQVREAIKAAGHGNISARSLATLKKGEAPVLGWEMVQLNEQGEVIEKEVVTEGASGEDTTEGTGEDATLKDAEAGSADDAKRSTLAGIESALGSGQRTTTAAGQGQGAGQRLRKTLSEMHQHSAIFETMRSVGVDPEACLRGGRKDKIVLFRSPTEEGKAAKREMRLSLQKDGSYSVMIKKHIKDDRWDREVNERISTPTDILKVSGFNSFFGITGEVKEAEASSEDKTTEATVDPVADLMAEGQEPTSNDQASVSE